MIDVHPGDTVIIQAFDDIPAHRFLVQEVHDDCVTGHAIDGLLAGHYGEPDRELIQEIVT